MRLVLLYLTGLVFGVGISISGMANPAKVLNFFDLAGAWDASLLLVMGGALVTTFIGYRLVFRRQAPLLAGGFDLPPRRPIDARLIGGSVVFGIGWGIAGFCPGASLPALGTGQWEVYAFTGALIAGIFIARALQSIRPSARRRAAA
ncbi:DUF6691 family protein [Pseudoroseicyclus sp. CXY001]|uniref:DUF6691 family protein n=1 Tax=Pseudoroseicyclus sp. CXY001 TaxID=3242492 RepID=UPI00358DA44F